MLVLLSGGMDSTVALFHSLERATGPVYTLMFDYGQRHAAELDAAFLVAREAMLHQAMMLHQGTVPVPALMMTPRTVRLHGVMPKVGSLLDYDVPVDHYTDADILVQDGDLGIDDRSFIPHRNMLLVTIAAMYAHKLGVSEIVTGIRGGFPDCTTEFETILQRTLRMSNPATQLTLSSPVHVSRADTIRLAQRLPGCFETLRFSMTCFEGLEPPCGRCLPCIKRAQGFAEAGVADPLLVRLGVV